MYGYGFRLQCRYSTHIQSTNVHICIDTIHCKNTKIFLCKKKQQCKYIKMSFFRKKNRYRCFLYNKYTCYCIITHVIHVHVLHIPQYLLKIEAPYFWVGFFALKNIISGKLKFQSKMCHIIQLNKSLFAIFRLYILYSMCTIYMCIQSIKPQVLY
jgi:hypothetical protein